MGRILPSAHVTPISLGELDNCHLSSREYQVGLLRIEINCFDSCHESSCCCPLVPFCLFAATRVINHIFASAEDLFPSPLMSLCPRLLGLMSKFSQSWFHFDLLHDGNQGNT